VRDAGATRRWIVLALYVALIYGTLPLGPRIGIALLRTGPGARLLGPGLPFLVVVAALTAIVVLRLRQAPVWVYVVVVAVAAAYVGTFASLRTARLERTHLPEYGVAAWLAWRAVRPHVPGRLAGYAAGAAMGAAIGYGDELLQSVVPGRYYDLRDVALNAIGAVLGMALVAALDAGGGRHKRAAPRATAEIATRTASF
jgi:VanZ like protein